MLSVDPTLDVIGEMAAPCSVDILFFALDDAAFKSELANVVPHLRAFARSLVGGRDGADDLVQETLLKAWKARDRFAAGTNMRAWTFIILRNLFLSETRRKRFHGERDDAVADRILSAPAAQPGSLELADVYRAMQTLPPVQREALVLIGAGGFSYEEAADLCSVAVGTIKSRVARARSSLSRIATCGGLPHRRAEDYGGADAMTQILAEVGVSARA